MQMFGIYLIIMYKILSVIYVLILIRTTMQGRSQSSPDGRAHFLKHTTPLVSYIAIATGMRVHTCVYL